MSIFSPSIFGGGVQQAGIAGAIGAAQQGTQLGQLSPVYSYPATTVGYGYADYLVALNKLDNGWLVILFDQAGAIPKRKFLVAEGESLGDAIQAAIVGLRLDGK